MASINQKNGINIGANCTGIVIVGCNFKGNANSAITGAGWRGGVTNKVRVLGCTGVADNNISGSTDERPSSPVRGQQFYDVTLGIPIWWNTVANRWEKVDGSPA